MTGKQMLRLFVLLTLCVSLNVSPHNVRAKSLALETRVYEVTTTLDLYDPAPNDVCSGWIGPKPTDFGPCSLRGAITEATFTYIEPKFVHIKLPPGTYKLSITKTPFDPPSPDGSDHIHYGDLDLPETPNGLAPNEVLIEGTGGPGNPSIIDADFIDRVLDVGPNRSLTLKNLVLKNGLVKAEDKADAAGGGIRLLLNSSLTLENVRLTNNAAECVSGSPCQNPNGGAISSANADLRLFNVELDHNQASFGSAIYFWDGSPIPDKYSYTYAVSNAAIHHNTAAYSTVDSHGRLFLTNSTISENLITEAISTGFAEINAVGETHIQNSTIIVAQEKKFIWGYTHMLYVRNSILLNASGSPNAYRLCSPITVPSAPTEIISEGGNIFSDSSCNPDTNNHDLVMPYDKVRLGSLQQNGGLTPTIALLDYSRAINRKPEECKEIVWQSGALKEVLLTTDQRGEPRKDKMCDAGAYESDGAPAPQLLFLPLIGK